jgi:hypothetical protein
MSYADTNATMGGRRPSRRVVALIATAAVMVAVVAGAAVWALAGRGASNSGDQQWLAKVKQLTTQFPAGYRVTPMGVVEVTEQSVRKQKDRMEGATVIPSDCASPSSGGRPSVGTTSDGLNGETTERLLSVTAVTSPQPITAESVPSHCRAVMFYKPGFIRGFTSPVALPPIPEGVSVASAQAMRISSTVTDDNGQNIDNVQYLYSALLDEHHTVTVMLTGQIAPGAPREIDPAPAHRLFTQALAALKTS